MTANARIRSLVKRLIDERGFTQKYLAAQMGLSETWFSRWLHETDERTLSLGDVERLMTSLHEHIAAASETLVQIEHSLHRDQASDTPAKRAR